MGYAGPLKVNFLSSALLVIPYKSRCSFKSAHHQKCCTFVLHCNRLSIEVQLEVLLTPPISSDLSWMEPCHQMNWRLSRLQSNHPPFLFAASASSLLSFNPTPGGHSMKISFPASISGRSAALWSRALTGTGTSSTSGIVGNFGRDTIISLYCMTHSLGILFGRLWPIQQKCKHPELTSFIPGNNSISANWLIALFNIAPLSPSTLATSNGPNSSGSPLSVFLFATRNRLVSLSFPPPVWVRTSYFSYLI